MQPERIQTARCKVGQEKLGIFPPVSVDGAYARGASHSEAPYSLEGLATFADFEVPLSVSYSS